MPAVQFESLEKASLPAAPLHLAIGMFDGVHLGHRAVIESAVQSARQENGLSGVLTFWPHPSALLRPEHATKLMQDAATKARVLAALGVDAVITQPFTPEFAAIPAEQFLARLKQALPHLAAVYVGENFRFGRGRAGDPTHLLADGRHLAVRVFSAPRVNLDGEPISSTRVRAQLAAGEMTGANSLLGYTYFAEGTVVAGKQLGRTIGFPTLNLRWAPELRPRYGVYAVRVSGAKAASPLDGVANYGVRPTVEKSDEPRLEVHVFGDCPFTTGDVIKVEWLQFLRPEQKFADLGALRAQIARDIEAAKR